jgi:hypothetical protein
VSVKEKVQIMHQVWVKKMNTSEPPLKCRKISDDIKTGEVLPPQDKLGGHLATGPMVSGIKVA